MPADILDKLRTERGKFSDLGDGEIVESLDLIIDKASSSSEALSVLNSIVSSINSNGRDLSENIRRVCKDFRTYDRIATKSMRSTSRLGREFKDLGDDGKDSIKSINSELKNTLSLLSLVQKSAAKYGSVLEDLNRGRGGKGRPSLETPRREKSIFDSLTKFAAGGRVGGTKTSGDHYVARLNAGEEVLKREQARQIRNQLIEKKLQERRLQAERAQEQARRRREQGRTPEHAVRKYAEGGEIKGGPRSGDRNTIKVNAGEWILTHNQMVGLGRQLGLKTPQEVFKAAGGSITSKIYSKKGIRKFAGGGFNRFLDDDSDSREEKVSLLDILGKGYNRSDYELLRFSPVIQKILEVVTDIEKTADDWKKEAANQRENLSRRIDEHNERGRSQIESLKKEREEDAERIRKEIEESNDRQRSHVEKLEEQREERKSNLASQEKSLKNMEKSLDALKKTTPEYNRELKKATEALKKAEAGKDIREISAAEEIVNELKANPETVGSQIEIAERELEMENLKESIGMASRSLERFSREVEEEREKIASDVDKELEKRLSGHDRRIKEAERDFKEVDKEKELKKFDDELFRGRIVAEKIRKKREGYSDKNIEEKTKEEQDLRKKMLELSGARESNEVSDLIGESIRYKYKEEQARQHDNEDEREIYSSLQKSYEALAEIQKKSEGGLISSKEMENFKEQFEKFKNLKEGFNNANEIIEKFKKRDLDSLSEEERKTVRENKVELAKYALNLSIVSEGLSEMSKSFGTMTSSNRQLGLFKEIGGDMSGLSSLFREGSRLSGIFGSLGKTVSSLSMKIMPMFNKFQLAFEVLKKVVVGIQDLYKQLYEVVQLEISAAYARKTLDSRAGGGVYKSMETSLNLTREEMIKLAPEIKQAIRSGFSADQMKELTKNIKLSLGEFDQGTMQRALEATRGFSREELATLMSGGSSENLSTAISMNDNFEEIADLMRMGVFGGEAQRNEEILGAGAFGGSRGAIDELRTIRRMIEDFKQSFTGLMEGPLKILSGLVIEPLDGIMALLKPFINATAKILSAIGSSIKVFFKPVQAVLSVIGNVLDSIDLSTLDRISDNIERMSDSIDDLRDSWEKSWLKKVKDSYFGKIIRDAIVGAGSGALLGSIIPGVGTAIGSLSGAVVGAIAGTANSIYTQSEGGVGQSSALSASEQRSILDGMKRELKRIGDGVYSKSFSDKSALYLANLNALAKSYGSQSGMRSDFTMSIRNESQAFTADLWKLRDEIKNFSKLEGDLKIEAIKAFNREQEKILENHASKMDDIINALRNRAQFQRDVIGTIEAGRAGLVAGGGIGGYSETMASALIGESAIKMDNLKGLEAEFGDAMRKYEAIASSQMRGLSGSMSDERKEDVREYSILLVDLAKAKRDLLLNPADEGKARRVSSLERSASSTRSKIGYDLEESDQLILESIEKSASGLNQAAKNYALAKAEAISSLHSAVQELGRLSEAWREGLAGTTMEAMRQQIEASKGMSMQTLSVRRAQDASGAGIAMAKLEERTARTANVEAFRKSDAELLKRRGDLMSKLGSASGSDRLKMEEEIKKIDISRIELASRTAAKDREIRLKALNEIKEAAQAELEIKEKIVDLANQSLEIQLDFAQNIGAPMETIMSLEKRRIALVEAQLENAKEYYEQIKASGASEMEVRQASLAVQKAEAEIAKARLGAQRSIMEKIFGSMIGSFNEVAGIIGPNSDFSNARKFGMGYVIYPDGTVARGGEKTGGYRERLFEEHEQRIDVFDETKKKEERSSQFEQPLLEKVKEIANTLIEINDLRSSVKKEEAKEQKKKEDDESKRREEEERKREERSRERQKLNEEMGRIDDKIKGVGNERLSDEELDDFFRANKNLSAHYNLNFRGKRGFRKDIREMEELYFEARESGETLQTSKLTETQRNRLSAMFQIQSKKRERIGKQLEGRKERIESRLEEINQEEGEASGIQAISTASTIGARPVSEPMKEEASVSESSKPQASMAESETGKTMVYVAVGIDQKNGNITAYIDKRMGENWASNGKGLVSSALASGSQTTTKTLNA